MTNEDNKNDLVIVQSWIIQLATSIIFGLCTTFVNVYWIICYTANELAFASGWSKEGHFTAKYHKTNQFHRG